MSIETLLDEIRADLQSLASVKRVYDGVPDAVNEMPAVIVAAMNGRMNLLTHDSNVKWVHGVRIEVHVPRADLEVAVGKITAVASELPPHLYEGFVTDRYNGTIITTGNPSTSSNATSPLTYDLGPSQWGGIETYAMVCDFQVTTVQEITQ